MSPFQFAKNFQQVLFTIATLSAFALLSLAILETGREKKALATAPSEMSAPIVKN